ncbi:MAG: MBL fold metallo-hydrolase [Dehalococcoidia bacterium]|nr:MBL fold metallo-hydrolase [Dehalococcoidia bacterium]
MGSLDLTFIGSGNAFVREGACWNGFVANGRYLFEAPPQALMALNRLGIDPNGIEGVVLSHHHGDHLLGLPFLLLHWKYLRRTTPVTVIGPPETEAVVREICRHTYPTLFEGGAEVRWVTARPGTPETVGGLTVEAVEVRHDPKLTANLGYHAALDGRRFGYTGDSAFCDGVAALARASEVMVSECTSRDEVSDNHMNLVDDMPRVRALMAGDASLVLTHLPHDLGAHDLPRTEVARDFGAYRF